MNEACKLINLYGTKLYTFNIIILWTRTHILNKVHAENTLFHSVMKASDKIKV